MIGGGGNDTYGVDDLLDVVVEAAGGGTDTVQTFMAALSIENMANVENLSYLGVDADQFVGTGNSGANIITGGDLADTLSGLAGARHPRWRARRRHDARRRRQRRLRRR